MAFEDNDGTGRSRRGPPALSHGPVLNVSYSIRTRDVLRFDRFLESLPLPRNDAFLEGRLRRAQVAALLSYFSHFVFESGRDPTLRYAARASNRAANAKRGRVNDGHDGNGQALRQQGKSSAALAASSANRPALSSLREPSPCERQAIFSAARRNAAHARGRCRCGKMSSRLDKRSRLPSACACVDRRGAGARIHAQILIFCPSLLSSFSFSQGTCESAPIFSTYETTRKYLVSKKLRVNRWRKENHPNRRPESVEPGRLHRSPTPAPGLAFLDSHRPGWASAMTRRVPATTGERRLAF